MNRMLGRYSHNSHMQTLCYAIIVKTSRPHNVIEEYVFYIFFFFLLTCSKHMLHSKIISKITNHYPRVACNN